MPHASLKLIPGVDQNRTEALNEAGISESDLIRFVPDRNGVALPQKLGGWQRFYPNPVPGTVRALHAWADTNGTSIIGVGTDGDVYTLSGGVLTDRSPSEYTIDLDLNGTTGYFDTTAGSATVDVGDEGSNSSQFDAIFIQTQISVGGLVLFGYYPCIPVSSDAYQIQSRNLLGALLPATSTVTGGGATAVFTTTSGDAAVSVSLPGHTYAVGDTFPILAPTTVGGVTLSGNYIVLQSSISLGTFTITAANAATSNDTQSMNGGDARITYLIGQTATPPVPGFGRGGFGRGGFGTGVSFSGGRVIDISSITVTGTLVELTASFTSLILPGSIITVAGYDPASPVNSQWVVEACSFTGPGVIKVSFNLPAASTTPTVSGTPTITVNLWQFPAQTDWSLDNWGEDLIASPPGGGIYGWSPSGGAQRAILLPNSPIANEGCFVAMPQRQIVAYGSTFTGIQDPLLIRWCDVGDYTRWVGTVTNQAGSFRIPKGSKIVGGMQGPQQGLIWTDLSVWSMQYIGPSLVYSFNEIGTGCGLIGKKAMGSMSGVVFWMSQSQFFMLAGEGVRPIPCPIWDVIFQDIDLDQVQNIRCAPNSRFNEIAWFYPTIGSNGAPTKYVKFNLSVGQWDYGTLTRTAWIDQSVVGAPLGSCGNCYIYQHEVGTSADGAPILSRFRTGYFTIQEGDLKTFIDQVWPDMKWGFFGGAQDASVTITFYVTDYPGQTPIVVGPYTVDKDTQFITPRIRGRLVSIEIGSTDNPDVFWRLGNIRYRFQPDGRF